MSFKENLLNARSQIIIVIGIIVTSSIIFTLELWNQNNKSKVGSETKQDRNIVQIEETFNLDKTMDIKIPEKSDLSESDLKMAKIAWQYFENNYISETGLVNSVDKYNASTMWDTASYMMALISAKRIGIINEELFSKRMNKLLNTLNELDLFDDTLPNKSYNTISKKMVDYTNKESKKGIGWSAIDLGRLLVPFNIIFQNYPEYTKKTSNILKKWDFEKLVKNGQLYGAGINKAGKTIYLQEGRVGYEEYGAKSLSVLGYDVSEAIRYDKNLQLLSVNGIKIPTDARTPEKYNAHNYVVSEPYILDGIEFGWDNVSKEFAYRVYKAQEKRFEETGILTAVSEDNIDKKPYFVYNTVFTDGKEWNCITEDGKDASKFKSISTKAAIGWHTLYKTEYTKKLFDKVSNLYDEKRGWYSGLYEKSGKTNKAITCNTNAIIIESLAYKKFGKLLKIY